MSVLIKGRKMPEDGSWITVRIYPDGTCGRPDQFGDCSLYNGVKAIHVPPHGRLVDADALHEELYALAYARENEWLDGVREARGVDAARVALLDAPTIIKGDNNVDSD